MNKRARTLLIVGCAVLGLPSLAAADAVTDWNENAGKAATAACISPVFDPFHESRLYAMVHIAIHDALNAIDRRTRPYAYDGGYEPASPEAAVAAAAYTVLDREMANSVPADLFDFFFGPGGGAGCIAGGRQQAASDYSVALDAIPDGPAKEAGVALGEAAAEAVIALRTGDGSDGIPYLDFDYPEGTEPGQYRGVPSFPFAPALMTGWGDVTPFALRRADEFRPRPPFSVSCENGRGLWRWWSCRRYARDYEEVRLLGADDATGNARTADQSEIAIFWLESSPLSWNRIARQISAERGLDLWENARLFGLLNMAMADGYVASVNTKYHYRFWRPVTAIRNGDSDGNWFTRADPEWTPFDPTPPFPDYDSAHAVEGASAAQVMRLVFRTNHVTFSACSLSLRDETQRCGAQDEVRREFHSFSEAAAENGLSRVLVGYHFRDAVNQGLRHGRKIATVAVLRHMRPVYGRRHGGPSCRDRDD